MKLKFIYVLAISLTTLVYAGPRRTKVAPQHHQPICDDTPVAAAKPLLAVVSRLQTGTCPDVSKLRGICLDISTKTPDHSNPEIYAYAYEKKIYDAACVNFNVDSQAVARQKVQNLWAQHPNLMRCQANNFNVRDGHILKYAVATQSYNLIDDAAKIWGVNLNIIDPTDNKTVLDYVRAQMQMYSGTAMETELRNYYDILRNHGAKHRSEMI